MRKLALLLLTLFIFINSLGQPSNKKEQLYKAYQAEKNDSLRFWNHYDYIEALYGENLLDSAANEIEILKKEASQFTSPEIQFWTLHLDGFAQHNKRNYLESIIAYEKMQQLIALGVLKKSTEIAFGNDLITLGLNYSKIYDLENAVKSYQEAIRLLQSTKDSSNLLLAYINMGYVYIKSSDWESARNIFAKGKAFLSSSSDSAYSVILYSSISLVASKLGFQKEADENLLQAGRLAPKTNNATVGAFLDLSRGENSLAKRDYTKSIESFSKAVQSSEKWGDSASIAEAYESLGRAYWKAGNQEMALQNLQICLAMTYRNGFADGQKMVLKTLFDYYKSNGNISAAVITADSLITVTERLNTIQNNNRLLIANALFETEENTKKIASLQQENELSKLQIKQKNTINYILAGTAISILLIALLSYRNYNQKKLLHKQRIQELETEKQLIATEAVLKGQEEERSRLAKDLHDGLGGMLSGIKHSFRHMKDNMVMTSENMQGFERGLDMLDSSITELRRVAHSMMPETLLKSGLDSALKDFCISINGSGAIKVAYQSYGLENLKIDPTTSITLYRIVQELLNNSIKHSEAKQAVVQITHETGKLLLTVEDDGKGFDKIILEESKGIGWQNILNRLAYLKGKLDVQTSPGKGTAVNIEVEHFKIS
jgi:two-component system, NarL family, sensor kinase